MGSNDDDVEEKQPDVVERQRREQERWRLPPHPLARGKTDEAARRRMQRMMWTQLGRAKTAEEVRDALRKGADVNATDGFGNVALHCAVFNGAPVAVVQALLEAGANVRAQTEDGATALHLAALRTSSVAVLRALVEAGADVHARDNKGRTAADVGGSAFTKTLAREVQAVLKKVARRGAALGCAKEDGNAALPERGRGAFLALTAQASS